MLTQSHTELFFDRPAVQAQVLALGGNYRNLDRAGALIRTIARGSIRRVKKKTTVSPPGQPPRSRDPQARYKRIIYAWDPATKSLVIGHIGYRTKGNPSTVPSTHEFGKQVQIKRLIIRRTDRGRMIGKRAKQRRNKAFRELMTTFGPHQDPEKNRMIGSRHSGRRKFKTVSVRYDKRPVMKPALDRSISKLPGLYADSITTT